ncbi:MAG: hypothetical protein WA052_02185 [Microgenomates group bacterium]
MEKQKGQAPENESPETLDDLFMELFTPEFFDGVPPEQIAVVIYKLKQIEDTYETVPSEWLAMKNVLQQRGFLK